NFLMFWQVCEILPQLLVCALLMIVVRAGARLSLGATLLVGVCLLLLPLNGPSGLPHVMAFSLWLGYLALTRWRSPGSPHGKRDALGMAAVGSAAVLLVGFYFVGFDRSTELYPNPGRWATLRTAVQFLSVTLGPTGIRVWKFSGLAVLGVLLASG